jgi:hypothetical protein
MVYWMRRCLWSNDYLEVSQLNDGIYISQEKYVDDLNDKFKMKNSNPISTPMRLGEKLVKDVANQKIIL